MHFISEFQKHIQSTSVYHELLKGQYVNMRKLACLNTQSLSGAIPYSWSTSDSDFWHRDRSVLGAGLLKHFSISKSVAAK